MSKERSRIRTQCNPKGAVGYMLETLHLNAPSMDMGLNIWQYNQPPIKLKDDPYQVLGPQVQQMAARNWTRRMIGTKEECMGLEEIDKEAHIESMKNPENLVENSR